MAEHHESGTGGIANFDQRQAEALDALREAIGFLQFTLKQEEVDGETKTSMIYLGSYDGAVAAPFIHACGSAISRIMSELIDEEEDE